MSDHLAFIAAGYGVTWISVIWYMLRLRSRERETGDLSGTVRGNELD